MYSYCKGYAVNGSNTSYLHVNSLMLLTNLIHRVKYYIKGSV